MSAEAPTPEQGPAAAGPALVAGLGNPGEKYARTRHNIGFMLVDRLARKLGIEFPAHPADPQILWAEGGPGHAPVVLAKPMAYMNRSGPPLRRLCDRLQIPVRAVMVVHDDVDLSFGRIQIKEKGGDGGHKGVMSLIDAFGRNEFVRLRIGIGRPEPGLPVTEHVLSRFSRQEEAILAAVLERACQAAATAIREGAKAAMNRFNTKEAHTHQVLS